MTQLEWNELDDRAVAQLRALAADAVQKAGNGHPGTAMSLAPAAYLLFQRYLRHDPADPVWLGRDRFVLSCGHSSLTLYLQLFLAGYDIKMDDLKAFRTFNAVTPGHPEFSPEMGIEMTTGPLGQGIATAVGMCMANRYTRGLLDPDAAAGTSLFDSRTYVLVSDGDIQEGISAEASSIAGTQALGDLIVIWDDNHISIEGDTSVAFTEDVLARYASYGWHVERVGLGADGSVDVAGLSRAIEAAQAETERPSFIALHTIIGWPAPTLQNTGKIHGAAMGAAEVAATKRALGLDPEQSFYIEDEVLAHGRQARERGARLHTQWNEAYQAWQAANPERAKLLDRLATRELPAGWQDVLPTWQPGASVATRKASEATINALSDVLPELWGGSADLGDSNMTNIKGAKSFLPATSAGANASPYGRQLHFGIREHAMGAILNGITIHGLSRVFGGTFLVFSDYMRASVRLAAIMQVPTIFIWSHDSIGVGEDGPTHQPIEHLWSLRAIPGLAVARPADANETAQVWAEALEQWGPTGLCLTRQNVPVLAVDPGVPATAARRGGYVLAEASTGEPLVLLLATGSEVQIAVAARAQLEREGIPTRVVSLPCLEWFNAQTPEYRDTVLPPKVRARVSVEAGSEIGWWKYVGDSGACVAIDHFGASAAPDVLFEKFGVTAEAVVAKAKAAVDRAEASAAHC